MLFDAGKRGSSSRFRFRYQRNVIRVVFWEFLVAAAAVFVWRHSVGIAIFTFIGLFIATGIPILRNFVILVISAAYILVSAGLANAISHSKHYDITWYDYAGIGLLVGLISYGAHAFFLDWVSDATWSMRSKRV
jgi:hypothetical protein